MNKGLQSAAGEWTHPYVPSHCLDVPPKETPPNTGPDQTYSPFPPNVSRVRANDDPGATNQDGRVGSGDGRVWRLAIG